jgi:GrpB-like predicted nucleotidyltransferase (UPF0157 family)
MTLGLSSDRVVLSDHDDTWREEFVTERRRISRALARFGCQIEHIGSTAVPGIPAKPILDIAIGCPATTDPLSLRSPLEALGYLYRGDWGSQGGHLFMRGTDEARTHHVHVVALEDEQWAAYLAFRDLLRSDAKSRALYATAKRTLARRFGDDRKSYTDGKASTVQRLLLKARSNA